MKNNRGISKRQWLAQGLTHLNLWGVSGVKIEKMAQSLGIARAGFYWHFKNREDLLNRLLVHWVKESTEVVTANETLLALDPKIRLIKTAEMILEHNLGEFDLAIRQWALTDKEAAKAVRKVNRLRLEYLRKPFVELGFSGDEIDSRAMLFLCYHTWESTTFPEISRKRRKELIRTRIELLTQPSF